MHTHLYPMPTGEMIRKRRDLAPGIDGAFREFSRMAFSDGALDAKTKQLIAVAVAHSLIAIQAMEADEHDSEATHTP